MELHEGPKTKVNIKELFAGKKGVLFAVPGAFTPYCSQVYMRIAWDYTTVKTTGACDANNHTRLRLLHIPFLYVNSLVPDPPTYCKISLVPRPQVPDGAWERGYYRIELGILRNVFLSNWVG